MMKLTLNYFSYLIPPYMNYLRNILVHFFLSLLEEKSSKSKRVHFRFLESSIDQQSVAFPHVVRLHAFEFKKARRTA